MTAENPMEKKLIRAVVALLPYAENDVRSLHASLKDDDSEALQREVEEGQQALDFAEATLQSALVGEEHSFWQEAARQQDELCAIPDVQLALGLKESEARFLVSRYQQWAAEVAG